MRLSTSSMDGADYDSFQMGIPEAIVHSINQCEPSAHRWLYQNIVLTGGCANIPNFKARVERDVREMAPDHYKVSSSRKSSCALFKRSHSCFFRLLSDFLKILFRMLGWAELLWLRTPCFQVSLSASKSTSRLDIRHVWKNTTCETSFPNRS